MEKQFTMQGKVISHMFTCPVTQVTVFIAHPSAQPGGKGGSSHVS